MGGKLLKSLLLFLSMIFLMIGCTNEELTKVKGNALTYSEYFKGVDGLENRENITYYKPLPIGEMMDTAPESVKDAVNIIDSEKLPFEVSEQTAYLVTSKGEKTELLNQLQLTYVRESEYGMVEEFFIVSVTNLDKDPLSLYDFSETKVDTVGNEFKKEVLIDDIPIFSQRITTNGGLAFRYYSYDEKEKQVGTVVTSANEFYTYYNNHLYHVGYSIDGDRENEQIHEEVLQLTRSLILGN